MSDEAARNDQRACHLPLSPDSMIILPVRQAVLFPGMVLPLALYWRGGKGGVHDMTTTAALVLLGGFILRLVIVFSAQGV